MNINEWNKLLIKAGCKTAVAHQWAPYFAKHCNTFKINTPKRVASFLANVMVESIFLTTMRENLRYSAKGLANTWPNRYSQTGKKGGLPNAKANAIAGNPMAIANHCYANRMGNGSEASGDGWRHAGKGPIQLTGKDNYIRFFKENNLPLNTDTDKLLEPDLGALAACWFWSKANINASADAGDFDGCCDRVNIGRKTKPIGDAHGYANRKKVYNVLLPYLENNLSNLLKGGNAIPDVPAMEIISNIQEIEEAEYNGEIEESVETFEEL